MKDVIQLCRQTGAISAYAYLGDVGVSVTGDKRHRDLKMTIWIYCLKS